MFGSTALNIVIGLILIYLLYSLLATIIGEIIATGLGLRARNLERAIKRMLDDHTKDDDDRNKIVAFFESLFQMVKGFFFKNRQGLVKKFYDEPVIKYLSSNSFFSKPSYISPENFAKAIIDLLKRDGEGVGEVEKIKNALNVDQQQENKEEAIRKILNNHGSEDEKIKEIKRVFQSPLGKDTARHILSLLEEAKNNPEEFRLRLEQWFDDTMDQSTGWYKRNMQVVLLATGFCLAALFNASTFDIVKKLSKDKDARNQLVQMASSYIKENDSLMANITKIQADSSFKNPRELKMIDTMPDIHKNLQQDIDDAGSLLGNGWEMPESLYFTHSNAKRDSSISKQQLVAPHHAIVIYFPENLDFELAKKCYKVKLNRQKEAQTAVISVKFRRTAYFIRQVWADFWGYFITALAISLGAPFWFDLLSKLVKIRSEIPKTPKQRIIN